MAEFRMPSLGADMEAGTLVHWLVKPGDSVKRGDLVAEVETQKGVIDVEIFESGVVERLLVDEGAEVPVGTPIAVVGTGVLVTAVAEPAAGNGAHASEPVPPVEAVTAVPPVATPEPERPVFVPPAPPTHMPPARGRVRASPAARRIAAELGLDLTTIPGTRPDGAVSVMDVERALAAGAAVPVVPPAPEPVIAPAPAGDAAAAMRAAIAAAMARSKREIPHYYLEADIDLTRALAWLEAENRTRPVEARLLPAALLLKAVALAVRDVPEMNGFWRDGRFERAAQVHLGVGISLRGGGLVAPAIHDAASLTLTELMAALADLVQRARGGKLRSSELSEGTLTVTNLGDQGVRLVHGVIYPPQVALVGFGAVQRRPWVVDEADAIGIRPVVTATLAADHRASVGHRGAVFLRRIDALLQRPEEL